MRLRHYLLAATILELSTMASAALAWNGTGHEAVALVAWDQLTPPQREALSQVLKRK